MPLARPIAAHPPYARRRGEAPRPHAMRWLNLGDSDLVAPPERLWTLGYGQQEPIAETHSTCEGICSGYRSDDGTGSGAGCLVTDAQMLGGHSGGPTVDAHGDVVGWNVCSFSERVDVTTAFDLRVELRRWMRLLRRLLVLDAAALRRATKCGCAEAAGRRAAARRAGGDAAARGHDGRGPPPARQAAAWPREARAGEPL